MSDVWFISDTHFGHGNVIKYSGRPFQDADEMDETLIANWNAAVKPGDRIYHLGDFAFHRPEKAQRILSRLSGQKYLIRGNHDWAIEKWAKGFTWIRDTEMLKVNGQKIFLCHYAMRVWDCSHHGAWNLHGHSHGSLPRLPGYKQADMGVDCWGYKPVNFDTVREMMDKIEFVPVDHHGESEAPESPQGSGEAVAEPVPTPYPMKTHAKDCWVHNRNGSGCTCGFLRQFAASNPIVTPSAAPQGQEESK